MAPEQSSTEKTLRAATEWARGNSGILIAAGLGIATVGFVMLWLDRHEGLRSFYEEESSVPTLH